jgi:acetylornithine/N-succinyldiaminopimelate aminotransferase
MFAKFVVPSYARFGLVLACGERSYVWDGDGRRYLELAGGIAVCSLGHAHPEISATLTEQSRQLIHVSNLYYNEPQGRLAKRTFNSFHGRTLAGIAATGQEKVKKGFDPPVAGFKHVPFNDLEAMRAAITRSTTPEYLLGLRELCDERNLLLLFDEVQAGHFRTGKFQSWQRIVGQASGLLGSERKRDACATLVPDGVSMAKGLGGGFPVGAFWVGEELANVLSVGTHASTFGGTPLACAVALKVFDVIERENLAENARRIGDFLLGELREMRSKFSKVVREVRGLGLIIGIEFEPQLPALKQHEKPPAIQIVDRLHEKGVLTVPAANSVIRLLPALNLSKQEAEEGLRAIEGVVVDLATET